MFHLDYALNLLLMSIESLAISEGDVRSRLNSIYDCHLFKLRSNDFPNHLVKEWEEIKSLFTKEDPLVINGKIFRGSVEVSMRKIRNSTGSKIAKRILSLYYDLAKHNGIKLTNNHGS